jgi:hypothetical protein
MLRFEGPAWFQSEFDERGRIRRGSDGRVSVAWWLRDENGEWEPWMINAFTKID